MVPHHPDDAPLAGTGSLEQELDELFGVLFPQSGTHLALKPAPGYRARPGVLELRLGGSLRDRLGRRLGCLGLALLPAVVQAWWDEAEKVAVLIDQLREAVYLVHGAVHLRVVVPAERLRGRQA